MATLTTDEILDAIGNMTVLELSELLKSFEEKFGVTAAAPMMEREGRTPLRPATQWSSDHFVAAGPWPGLESR